MKRAFIYTIFLLTAGLFLTELKAQEVYLGEVKIIQNLSLIHISEPTRPY